MNTNSKTRFSEEPWTGHRTIRLRDTDGLARTLEPVDVEFSLTAPEGFRPEAELRIIHLEDGHLTEIPSQFYDLTVVEGILSGRVAFIVDHLPQHGQEEFRLYYGNSQAAPPTYANCLRVTIGPEGPQHRIIENDFYKIETMPESGQIWHMWNKKGSNTSWHHNEWDANKEKGGDPCHWAPNCWAAYPERITNGYDVLAGGEDIDLIDWNYAFGWQDPESRIISGPIFTEITRQGIVWPHPEHTNPEIKRDPSAFIEAQVTYRFYGALPWFYQSSVLETLKDMRCFFIRNCQFVFLANIFSHTFIAPDRTDLLPTDDAEIAVLRLMGQIGRKPYTHQQHSLSNVLPSKLAYYGFYNEDTTDGFALFQLTETNTNIHQGESAHSNHATLFSELPGWSAYYCRALSYTNQRYNPENANFLPKGERYEEENIGFLFTHHSLPETLETMDNANRQMKSPLKVTWET